MLPDLEGWATIFSTVVREVSRRRWPLTREQDMWNGGLLRRVSEGGTGLAHARKRRRPERIEQVERK